MRRSRRDLAQAPQRSDQAQALRRHLVGLLVRWTVVYVICVVAWFLAYAVFLADPISDVMVNVSSHSVELEEGEVDYYIEEHGSPISRFETVTNADGTVSVRDMGLYDVLRVLNIGFVAVLPLVGYIALIGGVLRRSVGYFEELSGAVAGLMRHREDPVRLSGELSIVQDELNDLRAAALADERAAAEAERRKNELVAYLAHDIRTPLTSVIGYLSLLDEAPDLPADQRRRYVSTALSKAELLDTLTAEFFEITRYNLSSIPIEREEVDVRLFLAQIVEEFLPELRARSLAAHVDVPPALTMRVDPEKMARVLGNVVRNAMAYASVGTTIELRARRLRSGGWRLTVTDTGKEIAPENLERIFERFFRADAARSSTGNAGLGLAIARSIVEAHGGTIRAKSAQGVTTFVIDLPA